MKEITLLLTEACNASCSFCTQKHNTKNNMTLERAQEVILEFKEEHPSDDYKLDLFGGEPLLNFETIQQFIPWVDSDINCKQIELFTNGILLTERIYEFCVLWNIKITLSYDPTKDNPRGYTLNEEILDIIRLDAKTHKRITVSFSIHRNGTLIKQQYLELEKLGLAWNRIDFYFNRNYWEWTKEDLNNFKIGFIEYVLWSEKTSRPLINRLQGYLKLVDSSEKFGCGGGVQRWTYSLTEKRSCGIIDIGSSAVDVPQEDQLQEMCAGCSIKDKCPKTCPVMLKQAYADGLGQNNAGCDLHKIIILTLETLISKH